MGMRRQLASYTQREEEVQPERVLDCIFCSCEGIAGDVCMFPQGKGREGDGGMKGMKGEPSRLHSTMHAFGHYVPVPVVYVLYCCNTANNK